MTPTTRRVLGLLATLPAFIALIVSYAWPTIWTVRASFQRLSLFGDGHATSVGWRNYHEPELGSSFGFGFLVAVLPMIAVVVVAPLVALAASRADRPLRLVVRLALTLPLVAVAPVALALSWLFDRRANAGDTLTSYPHAAWPVWVTTFAASAALAAIVYLSALRRAEPGERPGRPAPAMFALVAVGALAVLAVSLQVFTFPYLLGAPHRAGGPLGLSFVVGLQMASLGRAAAVTTVLLLVLAVLGIATVLILVAGGVRVEHASARPRDAQPANPGGSGLPAGILALAGAAVLLAVLLYAFWPWLRALGQGQVAMPAPVGVGAVHALWHTWLPPLLPAFVGVALAGLAGFGIGALRPLGRGSEWLLLVFAPWLFVGLGPLVPHMVNAAANTHLPHVPPVWVNLPVLVVTALFFRGQHARRAADGVNRPAALGGDLVRLLPLVAALFVVTWVALAQDTLWSLVATPDPRDSTVTAALYGATGFATDVKHSGIGLASPPPVLVLLFVGLVALQLFSLDRLRILAGRMPADPPGQPAPGAPFGAVPAQVAPAGWPPPPPTGAFPAPPTGAFPPPPVPGQPYPQAPGYPQQPGYPQPGYPGYPPQPGR